jgi:hypothetical protein
MKFPVSKVLLTACTLGWLAIAAASTSIPSVSEPPGNPTAGPSRSEKNLPRALRPALYRTLSKDAGATYQIGRDDCTVLPQSGLKACFDRDGAHFSGTDSRLTLHLVAYGRRTLLSRVKAVAPTAESNSISYVHDNLTEWWRVLPIGFEQGFTLSRRPSGHGALRLALATNARADQDNDTITWKRLHYGHLVVTDAKGHVVPATLKSDGKRILIDVNDRNATYPLTIDPLVWLEQKVTKSDGNALDDYGNSVAILGDTALVGAYHVAVDGNSKQGLVYVFTNSNGTWEETQKLTVNDGQTDGWFGDTVAFNATTAVIGANGTTINGNAFQGAVYVFEKSNGKWVQTQKLIADDGSDHDNFGDALALSGKTIVVGAYGNNSFQGAAYVFSKTSNGWVQSQKLTAFGGASSNGQFGSSVAIDGATIFVGASQEAGYDGAAYVFKDINNIWRPFQILTAKDGGFFDGFGTSVALSNSTALVGTTANKAYVFKKSGTNWSQAQELTTKYAHAGNFGSAVALQDQTAVIGAEDTAVNGNSDDGAVFIFSNQAPSGNKPACLRQATAQAEALL